MNNAGILFRMFTLIIDMSATQQLRLWAVNVWQVMAMTGCPEKQKEK